MSPVLNSNSVGHGRSDETQYQSGFETVSIKRNDRWINYFGSAADEIIFAFQPKVVYDVGCGIGMLVESFRDRGVECWGRTTSSLAGSQMRQDIRAFCDVSSLSDQSHPGPDRFDLVTCIGILEHIDADEALRAIDYLTGITSRILFSSSPSHLVELTHIDMETISYWLRAFAKRGFAPELSFNSDFIASWAFVVTATPTAPQENQLNLLAELIRTKSALFHSEQRARTLSSYNDHLRELLEESKSRLQHVETKAKLASLQIFHLEHRLRLAGSSAEALRKYIVIGRKPEKIRRNVVVLGSEPSYDKTELAGTGPSSPTEDSKLVVAQAAAVRGPCSLLRFARRSIDRLGGHRPKAFDAEGYLATRPDGEANGVDPSLQRHRRARGRKRPLSLEQPISDRASYLAANPDVDQGGIDPLVHRQYHGKAEKRPVSLEEAAFDSASYLAANPDVAEAGFDPFTHWQQRGQAEKRPLSLEEAAFDEEAYLAANPDVAEAGLDALSHWREYGKAEGRPLYGHDGAFDAEAYLAANPDVASSGLEPLSHWLTVGRSEGRFLTARENEFDPEAYVAANPDVTRSGLDPLKHWRQIGYPKGRAMRLPDLTYQMWIEQGRPAPGQASMETALCRDFQSQPLISIITPVYKVDHWVLNDTIQSVVDQSYPNWELCLSVADQSDEHRSSIIRKWLTADTRIKAVWLKQNFGISGNSNVALEQASGEWIGLLDHDDMLTSNALFEMVKAINRSPEATFLYSDKDQIDESGIVRQQPLLKGEWSPDIMLCANYLTHFNLLRKDRLLEIGGWDSATDGAQDWDLFLRFIRHSADVVHVPGVLYHWRQVLTSVAGGGLATKTYAYAAQLSAVQRHLDSTSWLGATSTFDKEGAIHINWPEYWAPTLSIVHLSDTGLKPGTSIDGWANSSETIFSIIGPADDVEKQAASILVVIENAIERANGDIIVIVDDGIVWREVNWLTELVGPLFNPEIDIVSGLLLNQHGTVEAIGAFLFDEEILPGFAGLLPSQNGSYGNPSWYANTSACSLRFSAFHRDKWPSIRSSLSGLFYVQEKEARGRILLNPFAVAQIDVDSVFSKTFTQTARRPGTNIVDKFISPHLTPTRFGWMTFKTPDPAQ